MQAQRCPHCGLEVKRLKRHIEDVHEKQECMCPHCAKVFTSMRNLLDHVKHTHDSEGQKFICHICSKDVTNALSLKQHLRRVHFSKATREKDF